MYIDGKWAILVVVDYSIHVVVHLGFTTIGITTQKIIDRSLQNEHSVVANNLSTVDSVKFQTIFINKLDKVPIRLRKPFLN